MLFLWECAEMVERGGSGRLKAGFGGKIKVFVIEHLRAEPPQEPVTSVPEGTHSVPLVSGLAGGPQWVVAPGPGCKWPPE